MDQASLALFGPYGPRVLNCGTTHTGSRSRTLDADPLNSYRLLVVGTGALRVDPPGRAVHRLPPRSACLLVPGSAITVRMAPKSALHFVIFDAVHHPLRGSLGRLAHRPPYATQPSPTAIWGLSLPDRLPTAASAEAYDLWSLIHADYWRGIAEHTRADARLGLWLANLVIEVRSGTEDASPASDPFEAAERHVRRQAPHVPTVKDLAARCGMSREHFSRAFKHARGISPARFLDRERWQQAQRLLTETGDPLLRIARHLGYQQTSSFTRAFGRRFGCTPSAYRRQHRQGR